MDVICRLGELVDEIDGMLNFRGGPNRDFENKSPEYSHGFVVTFRDRAAHLAYERHPRHVELGARLVSMCRGGAEGIVVYDIDSAGS